MGRGEGGSQCLAVHLFWAVLGAEQALEANMEELKDHKLRSAWNREVVCCNDRDRRNCGLCRLASGCVWKDFVSVACLGPTIPVDLHESSF